MSIEEIADLRMRNVDGKVFIDFVIAKPPESGWRYGGRFADRGARLVNYSRKPVEAYQIMVVSPTPDKFTEYVTVEGIDGLEGKIVDASYDEVTKGVQERVAGSYEKAKAVKLPAVILQSLQRWVGLELNTFPIDVDIPKEVITFVRENAYRSNA